MQCWKSRKQAVGSYYSDWTHWLPIMEAYSSGKPSYFGTPAVNLVAALEVSLQLILDEGLEQRFRRHRSIGAAMRAGLKALGLDQVPVNDEVAANTLSAPKYPEGLNGPGFLAEVTRNGIILAGGLLPQIRNSYFRIGHMGSVNQSDVTATLSAVGTALVSAGHPVDPSTGVRAALNQMTQIGK
jgi:alanine-glyoxylate transaminase/serine-glyoxylate transaminase/serine-pyruvate transaminase